MPPPVVYVAIVVVAAGIGLYHLVKKSGGGSSSSSRFSNRRMNKPHETGRGGTNNNSTKKKDKDTTTATMPDNDRSGGSATDQVSGFEMDEFTKNINASASAVRSPGMNGDIRQRRTRSGGNEATSTTGSGSTTMLDGFNIEIPFKPLEPTLAPVRGDTTPTAARSPVASPPRSPFVLECDEDAATLSSLPSTPSQAHFRSLEVSPFHSPPGSTRIINQLPTPSDSGEDSPPVLGAVLPSTHAEPGTQHILIIRQEPSQDYDPPTSHAENPFGEGNGHEDLLSSVETRTPLARSLAPSMSMHSQASSSSALSFNTAHSPPASEFGGPASDYTALSPYAEFLSFPPTRATSPFSDYNHTDVDSDVFTLSPASRSNSGSGEEEENEDDLHSLSSRSSSGSRSPVEHLGQPTNLSSAQTVTQAAMQARNYVRSPPRSEDGYIVHDFDDSLSESSSNGWENIDTQNVWQH